MGRHNNWTNDTIIGGTMAFDTSDEFGAMVISLIVYAILIGISGLAAKAF